MHNIQEQLDRLLPRVEKPARYIGGEFNIVCKDNAADMLNFGFCFPDTYEIGMSYVGMQILYNIINKKEHMWCQRVFCPAKDCADIMEKEGIPLFTLESKSPVGELDVLGFTLQYELSYTNVLKCLQLGNIPLLAADRSESDPLIIGGGPCVYNPEPLADFFDAFLVGDGEENLPQFLELARQRKIQGWSKRQFLEKACEIQGVYVPSFYKPVYEDGKLTKYEKLFAGAPDRVLRAFLKDLSLAEYPEVTVGPLTEVVFDRPAIEIFRGCTRGCRFCQAGMTYRPVRERSVGEIIRLAKSQLASSGAGEISLMSLSSSDYSQFGPLVSELLCYCKERKVNITLPSLRMDNNAFKFLQQTEGKRRGSITFAAEAGTQRLRNVINKNITEENILSAVSQAIDLGYQSVKLYFMMGLPTETYEDLQGIVDLSNKVMGVAIAKNNGKRGHFSVSVSVANFVPKPCTPFQWFGQNSAEEFEEKHRFLKEKFKELKGVVYHYHGSFQSILEAIFARGGRELAPVLLGAFNKGCCYDSWTEGFKPAEWKDAFNEAKQHLGIDFIKLASQPMQVGSFVPWDVIDSGISENFLVSEWEKAIKECTTDDCRLGCKGCGINRFTECKMENCLNE